MTRSPTVAFPRARRLGLAFSAVVFSLLVGPASAIAASGTYTNPILPEIPGDGVVETCADPSVIAGPEVGGVVTWYMYCTTDPLNDEDRNASGGFNFQPIPMFTSTDLVNWTYVGNAFDHDINWPDWAEQSAGLWAPEIDYFDGVWYLYYGVTDVTDETSGVAGCSSDSAIGVATSDSPLGPWVDSGDPVVDPRPNGAGCNFFWTYDPEVIEAQDGTRYIYYGSYYGGIEARILSENGTEASAATAVPITIANRYEGPEVIYKDGYYYLFVSATNCCNGPITGYSVFVGRSTSPTGPFVDAQGVSLLDSRVGGSVFLTFNGNGWVGPGHNTVFQDFDGQWWTIYHAVDENDPYMEGAVGFTKRPAMLDAIDWVNGWPVVNGGQFISDTPQQAPAAQPGDKSNHKFQGPKRDTLGKLIFAEEFSDPSLSPEWSWVREPATGTYEVSGGTFQFDTQAADLFVDSNSASVLVTDAPDGNFVVETRVHLDLPASGCCFNYTQAGLVIYGDDDNFLKLVHVSIWETRQTEWAKELAPVPAGYPRYGNTVVGPPGEWTYLRIAVRQYDDRPDEFTAYTSNDGVTWVRGATWTHDLGDDFQIGLVSMGGAGFEAEFDYVRVYSLNRGK
jgi:arabinan endo-1,5-alpha-L-arabinosidase